MFWVEDSLCLNAPVLSMAGSQGYSLNLLPGYCKKRHVGYKKQENKKYTIYSTLYIHSVQDIHYDVKAFAAKQNMIQKQRCKNIYFYILTHSFCLDARWGLIYVLHVFLNIGLPDSSPSLTPAYYMTLWHNKADIHLLWNPSLKTWSYRHPWMATFAVIDRGKQWAFPFNRPRFNG